MIADTVLGKRLKKRLGHVVQETRCSRAFSEEKPTELQSTNSHVEESRSQALLEPEHDHSTPEMQGRSLLIFPKESLYNISPFGAGYAMMAGIEIPSLDVSSITASYASNMLTMTRQNTLLVKVSPFQMLNRKTMNKKSLYICA